MPATSVGIVYSASQQVIRRTIDTRWDVAWTGKLLPNGSKEMVRVPAANPGDHHLAAHQNAMMAGEAWATVPCDTYDSHATVMDTHAYLGLNGVPGVTDRYAHLDGKGNVLGMYLLDPAIEKPKGFKAQLGHSLVQDSAQQLMAGATFVNGVVTLPTPVINPVNGMTIGFTPVSQSTVSATVSS